MPLIDANCSLRFQLMRSQALLAFVARWCARVTLSVCAATSAQGQQPQSSVLVNLRMVVMDAQEHPVAGATCSLFRAAVPAVVVASAMTGEQGAATFQQIAPGAYTLRIEAKGFETLVRNDLVVRDDEPSEIKSVLSVASLAANVTIATPTAEAATVVAGASTPSGDLRGKALERLPLATARIDEALPLIPGVLRSTTGEISIKGATEQQSAVLVNGLNAADPASGNFRLNLPVDSVESVQVFLHPSDSKAGTSWGSPKIRRG
jgi:Carboxypeptidase regulatory-like domain/TonB-dependent Receptor Plug Domain